ncbi:MAG: SDR family oxidoreductase [Bacteroidota bacterium]
MNLGLTDKIVILSGGAGVEGSISHAIFEGLIAEGAIPILLDTHPRGKSYIEQLQEKGGKGHFIQVDLTDPIQCKQAIEETIQEVGPVDVLINLAGGNDSVGLDASYEAFVASLHRNLIHFFLLAKHSLSSLKAQQGCILNIGSKVALTGQGNTSGYAAAKAGILGLTREWAVDLSQFDIRVNALIISECWTPGYESWINQFDDPKAKLKQIEDLIPLGRRMTRPKEIAHTALFLISTCASHITGQFVFVDGGYRHLDRALGTLA